MSNEIEAYRMARDAAKLDFGSAMRGLLAGHSAAIDEIRDDAAKKDMAFLMALALTEKGARLDKEGLMIKTIADGLRGLSLCATEQKFLERADAASEGQ